MTLFYYDLESIPERYTQQLCKEWMPHFFNSVGIEYQTPAGIDHGPSPIKVGSVLDATQRGMYSLEQNKNMLGAIEAGAVTDEDVIFLQDFWTPGFEAVLYSLDLHKLSPRIYAMVHAQTVDQYDFTFPMRSWMRPMESGLANRLDGAFVASTIHQSQLKAAGWECPIHVVGLPILVPSVKEKMGPIPHLLSRPERVIYSSRLDAEKQPMFMLKVAEEVLRRNKEAELVVTTSTSNPRSNVPKFLRAARGLTESTDGRFQIKAGLTKEQYYAELCQSRVQLNTSLQDYVSWTLLEASIAGCDLVYPNFRSFPECVPLDCLYHPWSVVSASELVLEALESPNPRSYPSNACELGGLIEAQILQQHDPPRKEYNLWTQKA